MPVEIRVPQLGESIVEATIAQWLKNPGESVTAGESLVELETEKVNQTVEAESSGVLSSIRHNVGDTVGVGEVIGIISENGASPSASQPAATPSTQTTAQPAPTPPARTTAQPAADRGGYGAPATPVTTGGDGADGPAPVGPPAENAVPATVTPVAATPVASAIASANNIDLASVTPTGPGGKVGKDDVVQRLQQPTQTTTTATSTAARPPAVASSPASPAPPAVKPAASGRPEERIRMTKKRATIAANLKLAQNTAASLTTFNEVDMSRVMELRKRRKDDFQKKFGVGLGFMSFFTKAAIGALKQFPYVNAEIQNDEIVLKKYYDIGIAVGVEDGLVVPIVRDADRLSFAEIEKRIADLAGKAKENKLTISDMIGGTFTITNGGVFGSMLSTPILNYPQVAILGLHAIKERPVVVEGAVVVRPIMYMALSYDHRIIDGSTAVRFLVKIKELIEDPETLLLEG